MERIAVLEHRGPPSWASHQDIKPALEAVWETAGFTRIPLFFPTPQAGDPDLVERLLKFDVLLFPLGSFHVDGLSFLETLRRLGYRGRAVFMCAGDGARDQAYLRSRRSALRADDLFVTNCPAEARVLKTQLGAALNVVAIPLPLLEKAFFDRSLKTRAQWRKRRGVPNDAKLILYAGRVSAQKNLLSVLAVLKSLRAKGRDVRLAIAGAVDDFGSPHLKINEVRPRFIDQLIQFIQNEGLTDAVEFLGFLDQHELNDAYQACDVFTSLTLHASEDFGYAVAQAIAAGVPTVVTAWGGGAWFTEEDLADSVTVWLTRKNGVKIAFDEAATRLRAVIEASGQNASVSNKKAQKRKLKLKAHCSVEAVAATWKRHLKSKAKTQTITANGVQAGGPLRFKAADPSRSPIEREAQNRLQKLSALYGAKPVRLKAATVYQNPLWWHETQELRDPVGFKTRFRNLPKDPRAARQAYLDEGVLLPIKLRKQD